MNVPQKLRKRINFQGDFDELLTDVSSSYKLGKYLSFIPIDMGYEDVNIKLTTTEGNYFVKIFAEKRDDIECLRLINIVKTALDNGVNHPKFLAREAGYIFRGRYEDFNVRLAVFEFIEGKTFYELNRRPTSEELSEIIEIAAKINKIDHKPADLYDSWALVNFPAEFKKIIKLLEEDEIEQFKKLLSELEKIDLKALPHSLVHGDLISTNLIKSAKKIYCVDFSVANYYPRVVELAVLMCDIMLDPDGKIGVSEYYKTLLTEYERYIKLTGEELEVLPLFIKLAHSMHIIGGLREKKKNNSSTENEHWIALGRKGLRQTLEAFK